MDPIAQRIAQSAAPAPSANVFTDEEIAALEAAHRRIARVPGGEGDYEIVFRSAKKSEWSMFRKRAHDDDVREKAEAQEVLLTQCVIAVVYRGQKAIGVTEARKLLAEVLDDYPQIPDDKNVSNLIKKVNGGVGDSGK